MNRLRSLSPPQLVAAGVALVALVVGGLGAASASRLDVTAHQISTATVTHPCPGTLTATTPSTSVAVSAVTVTAPSACAGRELQVAVVEGTTVRTGTAVAPTSGSVTVTLNGSFLPSASTTVQSTVSGWALPATWSYVPPTAGPVVPGNPVTVVRSTSWNIFNHNQACVTVDVSTNTTGESLWRVDLVVAEAPFHGATSGYTITQGQVELAAPGVAVNGRLGIQGKNNGWDTLTSSQARQFTVCHYNLPTPPDLPGAYTTSVTQGPTWTDTQACLTTTITGNGTSSYYVGWQAAVDMSSAYQRIESTGRVVGRVQQDFSSNIATISPAPSRATSSYTITTGWQGVLRLNETRSLTVCAYQY